MNKHVSQALSVVILAAGKGTRMRSQLPKVLHSIGGKPMLSHVVDAVTPLSPAQLIVIHGQDDLALLKSTSFSHPISWVLQPTQQGTGDALSKALPIIPADHQVLVLYGDVPLIRTQTLQRLLTQTAFQGLGLMTVTTPHAQGLGRIIRKNGHIVRIVEERDASHEEKCIQEVNTGIFVSTREKLGQWLPQLTNENAQKEYYLTDVIAFAAKENHPIVTVDPTTLEEIMGVNDKVQQAYVERLYQRQRAEKLLQEGVRLYDPNRIDIRGDLQAEEDVTIDINVIFEGKNTLHKRCHIGPHCVLINCEIGENVTLHAFSHLEGVKIEKNAIVGPFARIRPGTILSENTRVGNFVEIKNAAIGAYSKISHLSYIGDTIMGKAVNIGAGVITCNYDGITKHTTVIEDDVHIGSDSQLIAPVTIGKGAMIGAGSTVTKDAPAYHLTLTHQLTQRYSPWEKKDKKGEK